MTRSIAIASLIGLVLMLAGPAGAERLGKGHSLVFVGIGGHTGQFVSPQGAAYGRFDSGEVGGHLAYQRFLSDHWTLGVSGGYHGGQMKVDEAFFGNLKLSTHSFTVRVGGDRYAFIDDDVALYAGPGVLFSRGRATLEDTGGGSDEGPDATEVGFNGRIGMYARLRKGAGLFGHIGQVLSRTSSEDATGKASWWSSTSEGSVGLAFDF
jgi:hypothetical protein